MKYKLLSLEKNINNIKQLLFYVLLFTFIFVSSIHAATYNYYFSDDATGNSRGSDSNSCLDGTTNQCRSLSKAQSLINAANSDDTVNLYFDKSDKWTMDTYCSGSKPCTTGVWGLDIGTDDPKVNIDSYGSGANPIFDGSVSDFSDPSVPSHDPKNGPYEYSSLFRFKRDYCSVKNLKIINMYGSVIAVGGVSDPADYFVAEGLEISNFGKNAFYASEDYGTQYSTFTKNLIYNGGQLYVQGKSAALSWGIAISVSPWDGDERAASGNTISYNVIYNISGEVIHGTGSTIEYNLIGDSGSIGIYVYGNKSDMKNTIIRYNLITMSDWSSSIYDDLPKVGPEGIIITDELDGGDNSGAKIEVYGNVVINRKMGIGFHDYHAWATKYGEVRIYNNTVIDSHLYNYYIGNYDQVVSGKGFMYNNLSILYDQTGSTHALDHNDPDGLSTYWTIDNNAFWTTGGFPIVDSDWKSNYVTGDPKLSGEEKGSPVSWTSQSGPTYYKDITFADVTPNSGSALINTGKTLRAGFQTKFLTYGTDFSKLPDIPTFKIASQSDSPKWSIGAIVIFGTPISEHTMSAPMGLIIEPLQ